MSMNQNTQNGNPEPDDDCVTGTRPFPEEGSLLSAKLEEYLIRHIDLENVHEAFILQKPPKVAENQNISDRNSNGNISNGTNGNSNGTPTTNIRDFFYPTPSHFVKAQLEAVIEDFRDTFSESARLCGKKFPHDNVVCLRAENGRAISVGNVNVVNAAGGSGSSGCGLATLELAPASGFQRYPVTDTRGLYTKFIVLVQGQTMSQNPSEERLVNLGMAYCERFTKAQLLLKGATPAMQALKTELEGGGRLNSVAYSRLVIRKLKSINFMAVKGFDSLQWWGGGKAGTAAAGAAGGAGNAGAPAVMSDLVKQIWFGDKLGEKGGNNSGSSGSGESCCLRLGSDFDTNVEKWLSGQESTGRIARFNDKQKVALALDGCIERGPICIQGPPGTGKSTLIAHGLLPQMIARNSKVLLVTNSNCALDSTFEKITDQKTLSRTVRIGFKAKVSEQILQRGYYRDNLPEVLHGLGNGALNVVFTTVHNASSFQKEVDAEFCSAFDTLVLDEAGQIQESKLFSILARLKSIKKVVLIGDHKQLQPYVCDGVRVQGYGVSTMERLLGVCKADKKSFEDENGIRRWVMLEVQHRMPTAIRTVVSELFYAGKLRDPTLTARELGGTVNNGMVVNRLSSRIFSHASALQCKPILCVDLKYGDPAFDDVTRSRCEMTEVKLTKRLYDFFIKKCFKEEEVKNQGTSNTQNQGQFQQNQASAIPLVSKRPLTSDDICVLSPYNRQKKMLWTEIAGVREDEYQKFENSAYEDRKESDNKPKGGAYGAQQGQLSDLEQMTRVRNIDTVDKFQGSEKEIVIINTVVHSKPARAGDPHFINVAVSRAKRMLVLVGHISSIAKRDKNWRLVYEAARNGGCVLECESNADFEQHLASYEKAGRGYREAKEKLVGFVGDVAVDGVADKENWGLNVDGEMDLPPAKRQRVGQ